MADFTKILKRPQSQEDKRQGCATREPWDCTAKRIAKSDRTGVVPLDRIVSVESHCKAVGCVAKELIRLLPQHVRQLIPDWVPFVCAAHDSGKLSLFQEDVRSPSSSHEYHELLSARALYLHSVAKPDTHTHMATWYGMPHLYIVLKHHGGSRQRGDGSFLYFGDITTDHWDLERAQLLRTLEEMFPYKEPLGVLRTGDSIWKEYLAGLLCVADWLGSDERLFPLDEGQWVEIPVMARKAALRYSLLEDTSRYLGDLDFKSFWGGLFSPNDMQSKMLDIFKSLDGKPAIVVVENGMGTGKTEAAVTPALNCGRGLFFGLPSQVTSNRIFERLLSRLKAIGYDQVTLSHGKSSLYLASRDVEDGLDNSWFSSVKRAMLSSIGVGTADQAMLSAIPARKHHHVRLFGLAGRVLILDEVHSYDAYSSGILRSTIDRHLRLGGQVIVLSATLTRGSREKLLGTGKCSSGDPKSYPCISVKKVEEDHYTAHSVRTDAVTGNYGVPIGIKVLPTRVGFKAEETSPDSVYEDAIKRAEGGQLVLWVENTVKAAQGVYTHLKRRVPSELHGSIGLLHSAFMMGDRNTNEGKWLQLFGKDSVRGKGAILVSTQVCEQSVDIDADYLISRLCPMDMLLQRIGRLWRHRRGERPTDSPEVTVLAPDCNVVPSDIKKARACMGSSAFVYHPYVLLNTLRYLRSISAINLPDGIRAAVDSAYLPGGEFERDFRYAEVRQGSKVDRSSADRHMVPRGPQYDDEGASLSITDGEVAEYYGTREDGVRSTSVCLLDESGQPLLGGLVSNMLDVERSTLRATDRDGLLAEAAEELKGPGMRWRLGVRVNIAGELLGKDSLPIGLKYNCYSGLSR